MIFIQHEIYIAVNKIVSCDKRFGRVKWLNEMVTTHSHFSNDVM